MLEVARCLKFISEVTINIKMLTGSSMSNVDKFKLSGVVTC